MMFTSRIRVVLTREEWYSGEIYSSSGWDGVCYKLLVAGSYRDKRGWHAGPSYASVSSWILFLQSHYVFYVCTEISFQSSQLPRWLLALCLHSPNFRSFSWSHDCTRFEHNQFSVLCTWWCCWFPDSSFAIFFTISPVWSHFVLVCTCTHQVYE